MLRGSKSLCVALCVAAPAFAADVSYHAETASTAKRQGAINAGNVAWQCDYRIKKNVRPLPSTWERIKALNPVSFQQKAYKIWASNNDTRWGFVAHELQEKLDPSAATGCKDGEDIQSPDLMGILAGVTRALQEAMARIEALEVRALAA